MKHRRPRTDPDSDEPREAPDGDPAADLDQGDAPCLGPHHDPSVHTERESYAVTIQRCRGEYP